MPEKGLPPHIREFFARTGAEGGRAGTGDSKRRGSAAHYKRLSQLAADARAKKKKKAKR